MLRLLLTIVRTLRSVPVILLITTLLVGAFTGLGSAPAVEARDVPIPTLTDNAASATFTLGSAATTSAGVFQKDGTMIRTLWANRHFGAGTHTISWNGADDFGTLLPEGNYDIKVLSSNVKYTWEGVVGNTSINETGPTKYQGLDFIDMIAFAGNRGYVAKGYSEGIPTRQRFDVSEPNKVTAYIATTGDEALRVATDGNYVYWLVADSWRAEGPGKTSGWWITATKVSDDSKVTFPNGANVTTTLFSNSWSGIDATYSYAGRITGLAVQKTGPLLFVSHDGLNEVRVFNKTSGAHIRTTSLPVPQSITADATSNIWVVLTRNGKRVVEKYSVASNGTLTLVHSIPNLVEPLEVAVSPDGSYVIVADGGASQQLKAYSAANAAPLWTYGKQGGYQTNGPNVSYDKFFFGKLYIVDKTVAAPSTFIAFQDDGSFWVGDEANQRTVHFSKDRTVLGEIHHAGTSWMASVSADATDPTRVFNGTRMLEYQVDYSKPLEPNNGSWKLVRNWWETFVGGGSTASIGSLNTPVTFSNGRTYALQGDWLVELPKNGAPRRVVGQLDTSYSRDLLKIIKDGSIVAVSMDKSTNPYSQIWVKKPLTGFNSAGDPQWGPAIKLGQVPIPDLEVNGPYGLAHMVRLFSVPEMSKGGILPSLESERNEGFHFGGYNPQLKKWAFKVAPTTAPNYEGPFPNDEYFNLDKSVQWGTASAVHTIDDAFIWNYYGEGWKHGQAMRFTHVHESGLTIGIFGGSCGAEGFGFTNRDCPTEKRPVAGFGGNSFSSQVVKVGNTYYVYHSDESTHSGVHRWRIDNADSVQIQVKPVTLSYGLTSGLRGTYMKGADLNTFNTVLVRNDPSIAMNWGGGAPTGTSLSADNFSMRWEGFVKAKATGAHTIYATADDSVRVWIGSDIFGSSSAPVINSWSYTGAEQRGTTYLTAGKLYPIRIEYAERTGNANISVSWSGPGVGKEVIPQGNLFTKLGSQNQNNGMRLLTEYLPFSDAFSGDLYGWKISPTPGDGWSIGTNRASHRRDTIPDINVWLYNKVMTGAVTRKLAPPGAAPLTTWQFDADVSMMASANRGGLTQPDPEANSDSSGVYLDILDNAGKVIARFSPQEVTYNQELQVLGNRQVILKYVDNIANFRRDYAEWPTPLSIFAKDGKITFRYANLSPVTTNVFDPSSNWKQPQTLRVYAWYGPTAQQHTGRYMTLGSPTFTPNGTGNTTGGNTGGN